MSAHKVGKLAAWLEPAQGTARARVLLVHGLGEHSARHLNTVRFLNSVGIEVVRFDLRGCGESEGERQRIDRFSEYTDDVGQVWEWSRGEGAKGRPAFLLGHSLGGLIALYYAAQRGDAFRGVLASAPAYLAGSGVSPFKIAVGRLLSRVAPGLRIPATLETAAISRDPVVVKAYDQDPLNCRFNTVRQGNEILDAMEGLPEQCQRIQVPVLIAHGQADRLVKVEGSQKLLPSFASRDKKLEIFPGAYHELHNDLDRDKYFSCLRQWIDAHL